MKRDIQRIMLATAVPLFLIFILFLLKIVEVGMDWDFSHMGNIPSGKARNNGYSDSSADTQRVQPFAGQYVAAIFFIMVLVLFLQGDSRTYFL